MGPLEVHAELGILENGRFGGFLPVALLPCGRTELRRILAGIDILIMTGGGDIDPFLYGRTREGCGRIDLHRPIWEMALYRAAREAGSPCWGSAWACRRSRSPKDRR